MATRVTWFPAVIPSADTMVIDEHVGEKLLLLALTGTGTLAVTPNSTKGPSEEGVTVLDVEIPSRVVVVQAYVDAEDLEDLETICAQIETAMVSIPVRFAGEMAIGRLLIERDGLDDREIYAIPQSALVERKQGTFGLLDAEWLCPYPYFQDTADSTLTVPNLEDLQTSSAGDDIIDCADHDFSIGDTVVFATLTGGTGLNVGQLYYVIAANFGANTFQVSATPGGSAVNFTTNITAGTVYKISVADNVGDVDAPPLIKVYGPATEVRVINLTSGEAWTVTVTLADGTEWLEVDTTPTVLTIRKYTSPTAWSDAISGLDLTDGPLWMLRPGSNSIKLEVTGDGSTTRLEVAWRNRYAGL